MQSHIWTATLLLWSACANTLTWKAREENRKPSTRRWYETWPISFFRSARYDERLSVWTSTAPKRAEFTQAKQASTVNADQNCTHCRKTKELVWLVYRTTWKNYLQDIVRVSNTKYLDAVNSTLTTLFSHSKKEHHTAEEEESTQDQSRRQKGCSLKRNTHTHLLYTELSVY